MKKLTKTQIITVILLILYGIWEIYVAQWAKTEPTPVIRVDLVIIYPILLIFILLSVLHIWRNRKK